MKKILKALPFSLLVTPLVAYAQFGGTQVYLERISFLVQRSTLLLAALALLVFFWGLVKFINKAGDEKEHAAGRNLMIWGTVALFVMVSIWGLINFIGRELNLPNNNIQPVVPSFPIRAI